MPLRVLHIIDHTQVGGTQKILHRFLSLQKGNFHASIAVLGETGQYSKLCQTAGAQIFELGRHASRWSIAPFFRLRRLLQKHQWDLVHTHLHKSHILGTYAAKEHGLPVIIGDDSDILLPTARHCSALQNQLVRKAYLSLYERALRRCDSVLTLNSTSAEEYNTVYGMPSDRVHVIPCPHDEVIPRLQKAVHPDVPADTPVVIMIGRLVEEKDWMTFLRVAKQMPACTFLIAGTGPLERGIRRTIAGKNICNVRMLGHRNDVSGLLAAADVCLHTSKAESLGIVLLEAMAAGCPVVATRSNGPAFIIRHRETGLLADIGDDKTLARHVRTLLDDAGLRKQMAENARTALQERFDPDTLTRQISDIYTSTARPR